MNSLSHASLHGESGHQYIDGVYRIGSVKIGQRLKLADGLVVTLTKEANNLCASNYNPDIRCVWEGLLSIEFEVAGKMFKISDHDLRENGSSWSTFDLDSETYWIAGTGSYVEEQSRDHTYLKYRITKANSAAWYHMRNAKSYTRDRVD